MPSAPIGRRSPIPLFMDAGADLMLLHPDGSEEVLVRGGPGSVTDPMVSFDGQWVYYSLFHDLKGGSTPHGTAGRCRHLQDSRQVAEDRAADAAGVHARTPARVTGPGLSQAGSRAKTTSATASSTWDLSAAWRQGDVHQQSQRLQAAQAAVPHTLQLFVMDDDGSNVECIGHLNLGMALHPVVLKDGRVMFSSLESQGLRSSTLWGLWTHPSRRHQLGPARQRLQPGDRRRMPGTSRRNYRMGRSSRRNTTTRPTAASAAIQVSVEVPAGTPSFGPGYTERSAQSAVASRPHRRWPAALQRLPFSPFGVEALTPFARTDEGPADYSVRGKNRLDARRQGHASLRPRRTIIC